METMIEIAEEIGAILIWYIVKHKIEDEDVRESLLRDIFKISKVYIKEMLDEKELEE